MEAQPRIQIICFLIHDLGLARCFWALWPNQKVFEAYAFPQSYGVEERKLSTLRARILAQYPSAQELELTAEAKTSIYRRIRRAELPEHMQLKIQEVLNFKQSLFSQQYQSIGFAEDDLSDLSLLKKRYRQLATQHHPDQGGELSQFLVLQDIYHQILRKLPKQANDDLSEDC